jgi:GxxExxY protein
MKIIYHQGERGFKLSTKIRRKHLFENLSNVIIGAAIKVHKELGPGFLESIHEEALKIELSESDINFKSQNAIKIEYHGKVVGTHRLDLVIEEKIVVELKAAKELTDVHIAQLISYLKATNLKVGLLLNFAKPTLEIKRVVN